MSLISPHGGTLCENIDTSITPEIAHQEALGLPSYALSERQLCDLELLLNGGFSPLTGFMGKDDYGSVLHSLRLKNGLLWPMPITLDVPKDLAQSLKQQDKLALRDKEGHLLAILHFSEAWEVDKTQEAEMVYGTTDPSHPAVHYLENQVHPYYIAGRLQGIQLPLRHGYYDMRYSPKELRERFATQGWQQIIGFQTRNPMHKAHQALTAFAMNEAKAKLLIHPVVGQTKPGDIDAISRVKCYQALLPYYPENEAMLSLLPLAMRMAGPREALWHALIRQNYGCSHFIVGRDHAGPGKDSQGNDFYGPYEAQELLAQYQDELEINIVTSPELVYIKETGQYTPQDKVKKNQTPLKISGTAFREALKKNTPIPEWFSYPEVINHLKQSIKPLDRQGVTLFFTGLSGSGKSTIANALIHEILSRTERQVTLLDGDVVRQKLCKDLGFSKEDRNTNLSRIGYVATEITRHGGITICAAIAPYQRNRDSIRHSISDVGNFIEVYLSTPLDACEARDVKGLYKKARANEIPCFTGISDPYEEPLHPEITIDTSQCSIAEATQQIWDYLAKAGFLNTEDD